MKKVNADQEGKDAKSLTLTAPDKQSIGTLPLDVKKYQSHIEDFDLSEEQKVELLETLWSIMTAFVDLGFGVDSVQQILPGIASNPLNSEADQIEENKPSSRFNRIALNTSEKEDRS